MKRRKTDKGLGQHAAHADELATAIMELLKSDERETALDYEMLLRAANLLRLLSTQIRTMGDL